MASIADLLVPIPGDNPSGVNLYSTPLFQEVREARRQEDTGPQGLWEHDVKTADYDTVIRLTSDALATQTKDLFLASWLADALLNKRGFGGFNEGLQLLQGLIEQFWDTLYPEMEDGSAEFRASPLEWLGNYFEPAKGSSPSAAVKTLAITASGLNWLKFSDSRKIPTDAEAAESDGKREARQKAIKEGKLAPEEADSAVEQTPKSFYVKLHKDITSVLTSLKALDTLCDAKFGSEAPSFGRLRTEVSEVAATVGIILKRKRELEPDAEPEPSEAAEEASSDQAASVSSAPSAMGEIKTRDDAVQHILAAARFLRSNDPQSPVAYLVARGLRWGELRNGAAGPDPQLLSAASGELRTQVKKLALEAKWPELLDACEKGVGTVSGRAWLDVHRYAIRACEELGEGYQPVAQAIRAGLRALLLDYPKLPEMFLMDDTPTANLETQKWLRTSVLNTGRLLNPLEDAGNGDAPGVYERALESVNSGNTSEAIEALTRELAHSNSGRGRFIRRMELAQLLMAMSKEAVAHPILTELAQEIDQRKLEEWEKPELVARTLALLYRCMAKLGLDSGEMQQLHTRICKLNVAEALSCLE